MITKRTIEKSFFHKLLYKIIDYIPEEIANNFNISLTEESMGLAATISENQRIITWNVEKLSPGETLTLKFDLVLKEKFDESIIDKVLNTNEKVDITYKDFEGIDKKEIGQF